MLKRFQSDGYNCFVYDHRSWGSSEGKPRQEFDPEQQAEDYHDAVLFVKSLSDVDPSRVVIWGTGHGGGAAMIAAAADTNIKAVILQCRGYRGNRIPMVFQQVGSKLPGKSGQPDVGIRHRNCSTSRFGTTVSTKRKTTGRGRASARRSICLHH